MVDFTITQTSPLIYPNPINQNATLEYSLNKEEIISIELIDLQGRKIKSFIDNQKQNAGKHEQGKGVPGLSPVNIISYF